MGTIGNPGDSAMSLALAAVLLGGAGKRKRTQAEEDAMAAKRQADRDEDLRQARILKNICPKCSGKLIRGRKEKHNDYKRAWHCVDCNTNHSI